MVKRRELNDSEPEESPSKGRRAGAGAQVEARVMVHPATVTSPSSRGTQLIAL